MGLVTKDFHVPTSTSLPAKARYERTLMASVDHEAEQRRRDEAQQAELERLEAERKVSLLTFRRAQEAFRRHQDGVRQAALAERKSVAATEPTEREKIFLEEARQRSEEHKQNAELRTTELQTVTHLKQAKRDMDLKREEEERSAALKHAEEQAAAALAKVQREIEDRKVRGAAPGRVCCFAIPY